MSDKEKNFVNNSAYNLSQESYLIKDFKELSQMKWEN